MNVLILSFSPRKKFSTSLYLSRLLKRFMPGNKVTVMTLKSIRDYNTALEHLEHIDTLVFAVPVYVDSIPSTMLEYLEKLQRDISKKQYHFDVYAITNCGFYEGHQCQLALSTLHLFCQRANLSWKGGIGIGAGVMLGFIRVLPLIGLFVALFFPINLLIQTGFYLLFSLGAFLSIWRLRASILKKRTHGESYSTVWFCPRFLFVWMATFYWLLRALLLHGVMFWKLFSAK